MIETTGSGLQVEDHGSHVHYMTPDGKEEIATYYILDTELYMWPENETHARRIVEGALAIRENTNTL